VTPQHTGNRRPVPGGPEIKKPLLSSGRGRVRTAQQPTLVCYQQQAFVYFGSASLKLYWFKLLESWSGCCKSLDDSACAAVTRLTAWLGPEA
jgi:hypothetical protein